MRKKISVQDEAEIIKMYLEGISQANIAKYFKVSPGVIRDYIRSNGYKSFRESPENIMTYNKFLEVCQPKYEGKFTFPENVENFKLSDKINVKCLVHGDQILSARSLYYSNISCRKCSKYNKLLADTEKVINRLESKNFNNIIFCVECGVIKGDTYIKCKCEKHGLFKSKVKNILSSKNACKKCSADIVSIKNSKDTKHFINKASKVWGDLFDYSESKYINNKTPLKVVCGIHGAFTLSPNSHIEGKTGCPVCTKNNATYGQGWSKSKWITSYKHKICLFYIIKIRGHIKIGITSKTLAERFKRKSFPDYEVILTLGASARFVWEHEAKIKKLYKVHRKDVGRDFVGWTEVYDIKVLDSILKDVKI